MKIDVIDHSPTVKELKIEIDAETIRKKVDEVSGLYAKQATVPGFRKGHAPRSVVKTRYKEEIRGEVLRELVPQAITDAVRENDLSVLGEPDVHLDDNSNVGNFGQEPLTFH